MRDPWINKKITLKKPVKGLKVGETYKISLPPEGESNGCITVWVQGNIPIKFFQCEPPLFSLLYKKK